MERMVAKIDLEDPNDLDRRKDLFGSCITKISQISHKALNYAIAPGIEIFKASFRIQAAQGTTKKRGSNARAKYNTQKFRLGSANKAKVCIANRLARSIYFVLGGKSYKDIGYMRGDPREKQIETLVRKLKALGVVI